MNVKIKNVTEVKAVNQGIGRNDKFPITKIELENGREYLYKHGENKADGIVDTFVPAEWVSLDKNGNYDMSTEFTGKMKSDVKGTLKLKPKQYKK